MKAYTDLEKSKVLAEFLPHKSADGTWEKVSICGALVDIPESMQYRHKEIPFIFFSGVGIPCWSLAALLDVLPNSQGRYTKSLYWFDETWHCEYVDENGECGFGTCADNSLDACYEMILKLNELHLL